MRIGRYFLAAWLLTGCASEYGPESAKGGYSQAQLHADVFRVSFEGNFYTTEEKVADFALLRCAEIAIERGYPFFQVLDEEHRLVDASVSMPGTVSSVSSGGGTTTIATDGYSYDGEHARSVNTIRLLKEQPENPDSSVYEAATLADTLKTRYEIDN